MSRVHFTLVAGTLAAALAAAPAQAATPEDFSAIAKVTKVKQQGESTGVFYESLKVKGRKIGTSKLVCDFGGSVRCKVTWKLKDGRIKAKGKVGGDGTSKLKITRGKGAYKGADGSVFIDKVTKRRNRERFDFE
jgi:predicted secreted Zn-dependent protease